MTSPDESESRRRALAFNAVGPAINSRGYRLPLSARRAVADAVLDAVDAEDDAARRRAVAFQTRIDAGRAWARQHLTAEQQTGLLEVLAGREDAAASATPTDGLRDRYAAALREATCTGNCDTSETECARTRIQAVVWEHGQLAEVSGSPEMLADTILAPRDAELDQLRADRDRWQHGLEAAEAQLVQLRRTGAQVQARAEHAEAALGRVRAVAEELIKYGCSWTGSEPEAGRRILTALESPQEQS